MEPIFILIIALLIICIGLAIWQGRVLKRGQKQLDEWK